ncbi:MAG: CHAT domain-containing protein, partial [Bacteroidales bacterium]
MNGKAKRKGSIHLILLTLSICAIQGCKTPAILVTEEQRKGDSFSNAYDYHNAILHYKNSLSASRQLGVYRNLETEAEICRKIAYAYNVQGIFEEAYNYAYFAYRRDSAIDNSLGIIEDFREMGRARLYQGDFYSGSRFLDTVITISDGMERSLKSTKQNSIADTYLMLSQVQSVLGKYTASLDNARAALELYRGNRHEVGESECMLQIGKVTHELSNPAQAEVHINTSMQIAKKHGLNVSRQLLSLANIAEDRAEYEKAIRLRMESVSEARRTGIIPQVIWSLLRTGDTYAAIGNDSIAEEYYREALLLKDSIGKGSASLDAAQNIRSGNTKDALAFYREIGSDISEALVYLRMGDLLRQRKNLPFALTHYLHAEESFKRSGSAEGIAKSNVMLADIYLQLHQDDNLSRSLDLALKNTDQPETIWRIHYVYGQFYESKGLIERAITSYHEAIGIIENIRGDMTIEEIKTSYVNDKIIVYDRLINLLMKSGQLNEAFNITEKARARAFLDLIGNKRINFRSPDTALVQSEQELQAEILALSKLLHRQQLGTERGYNSSEIEEQLIETRSRYQKVLHSIQLQAGEYASLLNLQPHPISELQALADESTAFLVYWAGEYNSYVWIIRKNNITGREINKTGEELRSLTRDCRDILSRTADFSTGEFRSGSNLSVQTLKDAYSILIQPVEKELREVETIGIVPHKVLHLLPYQCLMDQQNHFLAEKKQLFYTPGLNTLSVMKKRSSVANNGILAMAIGDLEIMGFTGLPGTSVEVENIARLNENLHTYFGESTTESVFKELADRYGHIHLATHGYMDQSQPLFSFVLFAPTNHDDGLLTVNEIFTMSLNTELIVLSACQTGLGTFSEGDDMVGLSRAFLYAGSDNVMVSLWSVSDYQTAYLMTEFYKHIDKVGPVSALHKA